MNIKPSKNKKYDYNANENKLGVPTHILHFTAIDDKRYFDSHFSLLTSLLKISIFSSDLEYFEKTSPDSYLGHLKELKNETVYREYRGIDSRFVLGSFCASQAGPNISSTEC